MNTFTCRLSRWIAVVLLLSSLTSCTPESEPTKVVPRVKCFVVGQQSTGQSRRLSGRVVAGNASPLAFGVGGTVATVNVSQGASVSKGEVLASLDKEPLRLAVEGARAQLNAARAKLVETQQSYDRTTKMFEKRAASKIDLEKATSQHASARENLRVAKSDLDRKEIDLQRTELTAPFSGMVAKRAVDPFQEVGASAEAFVLESSEVLKVEVRVPETFIRDVDYGQVVQVTFPTLKSVSVNGTVSTIASRAESGNAFQVEVQLADTDARLLPGMTASVTFNFDGNLQGRTVYLIPLSTLAIDVGLQQTAQEPEKERPQNSAPVFLFDASSETLRVQQIVIGDARGNLIEVYEGLSPGDTVVSAGVALLREGMRVRLWSPDGGLSGG